MVSFKKMWDDVWEMILREDMKELGVVKEFSSGFIVNINDDKQEFISKDDFVDIWARMLFFNQVDREQTSGNEKHEYVYQVIKKLPYIKEEENSLLIKQI
ncbi:hypothetical protein [Clostridium sp. DL1XJH146]